MSLQKSPTFNFDPIVQNAKYVKSPQQNPFEVSPRPMQSLGPTSYMRQQSRISDDNGASIQDVYNIVSSMNARNNRPRQSKTHILNKPGLLFKFLKMFIKPLVKHPFLSHIGLILIFTIIYFILLQYDNQHFHRPSHDDKTDNYLSAFHNSLLIHRSTKGHLMPVSYTAKILVTIHVILSFLTISHFFIDISSFEEDEQSL